MTVERPDIYTLASIYRDTHCGHIIESRFKVGDAVEKFSGDYSEEGIVCGVLLTPTGALRYMVAHPAKRGWILHTYSDANLREVA